MTAARVLSFDVVREFKATLVGFHEDSLDALTAIDMEVRRFIDWIEVEQSAYWKGQSRHWREELAQAKNDLARRKLAGGPEHRLDTTEHKKAVRLAEMKLNEAEQKIELCKKWAREVRRASEEYQGVARLLANMLEGDPPPAVAALERMITALEAYMAIAPAATEPAVGSASSGSMARSTESAPATAPTTGAAPVAPAPFDHWSFRCRTPTLKEREAIAFAPPAITQPIDWTEEVSPYATSRRWGETGRAVGPLDKVVLAAGCLDAPRIYLERRATGVAGDSGWFIGGESEGAGEIQEAIAIADLVAKRPATLALLTAPAGSLFVLEDERVDIALNADGEPLAWEKSE